MISLSFSRRPAAVIVVLLALLALTGCQSRLMVAPPTSDLPVVVQDKALVVFMRPSSFGGAIQSSVYDTQGEGQDLFAGVVSAGSKVAYQAEPGRHLFMVVGENADFLEAQLEAGKRYHVLVSPRMGIWKARFSLLPIRNDGASKHNLRSAEFRRWDEATEWMAIGPEAEAWFRRNADSIRARKLEYLPKWQGKSADDIAVRTLRVEDGI